MKRFPKQGILLLFLIAAAASLALAFSHPALAQVDVGLQSAGQIGLSSGDPRVIAARIIQGALGFLGIVALGLLLYAGYLWMTAAGNEEQVARAKDIMRNGAIGLVIILTSFSIVTFIIGRLTGTVAVPGTSTGRRGGAGFLGGGGGFPIGVIEMHYPDRGQKNVARNTNIMVTFVEPMLESSLIDNKGTPDDKTDDVINPKNIQILKSADNPQNGPFAPARAALSEDGRTIVIDPIDLLGSSEENTNYTVQLGEGITTAAGKPAFGNFGAYSWEFEVGTFVDLEAPRIASIIPLKDSTHPRNVIIQVTFSEAMNPITASGAVAKGFTNISVKSQDNAVVDGKFEISNQYQTVEFVTNDMCGKNSCGQEVFCLPGNAKLTTLLRAATVSSQAPAATFPYDGLTDAAGNALDGNADGVAQGPAQDSFTWSFQTTNEIDLKAPVINSVTPQPYATTVPLDLPISAVFSKVLWFKTVNRQNIQVPELDSYQIQASTEGNQSTVRILHPNLQEETTYSPNVSSNVRDIYQNCYQPCVGP